MKSLWCWYSDRSTAAELKPTEEEPSKAGYKKISRKIDSTSPAPFAIQPKDFQLSYAKPRAIGNGHISQAHIEALQLSIELKSL
jgi:hypothetical protein